ncbi:MAG: hypothetical protein ACOC5S_04350 [Acidobacteriota bacterium]
MKKGNFKLAVILLSLAVFFAYCGKGNTTSSEATGFLTISIKEDPIVFNWNSSIEKWETLFTIVLTESGGSEMEINTVSTEAREGETVRLKHTVRFYGEWHVPANGSDECVWDYDEFNIPGKEHFDTLRVLIYAFDETGNYQELEKDFTNLSFVE